MFSPQVAGKTQLLKNSLNQQSSIEQINNTQTFDFSSTYTKEQKLPTIQGQKSRQLGVAAGKGGNPFMIKKEQQQNFYATTERGKNT